ncbi:MAG: hypothetical protein IKN59_06705 [Paludibacteraceae bacterium]|nr:hypothetical protein [Paludibacteraceae bacterium]
MKNIVKSFVVMAGLLFGVMTMWGQTTTSFGFENTSELSSFNFTCENTNGSTGIDTSKKKTGNSSLNLTMGGTSKKGIYMTTTTSYQNVTEISFQLASSDKGKTQLKLQYSSTSDFSSGVTDIQALANFTDLPGMPSSVSNNTFYQVTYSLTTAISGYLRFYFYQPSSSGKKMWMDDLAITSGGGGSNPPTPPTPSADATLSDLKVDGTTITGFSATTLNYTYTVPSGQSALPVVTATTTNSNANANVTQTTSMTGTASVLVTAQDGTTQQTYTVQFSQSGTTPPPTPPTPPSTDLTLHETEVYEALTIAGGYGTNLTQFGNREYEVYYASFDNDNNLSLTTTPIQKSTGITTSISAYHFKATDGWLEMETSTSKSNYTMTATDEFAAGASAVHKLLNNAYYKMRIKGYDQFSFIGKDNNATESKGKHFEVYVDGVLQTMTLSGSASIRRFNITTDEHVIEVRGIGASNNEFYGFSLRLAYVPKVKHLVGNDTTQVVYQTAAIRPITYYIKNKISDAELTWNGAEATGITLQPGTNDTVYLQGTANCPNGTYSYTISAKDASGTVVSSMNGSFTVSSKVECVNNSLLTSKLYVQSAMTPVTFRCYTINMDDISYQWTSVPPAGLTFTPNATNHTVALSGTPTQPGTYTYTVSIAGGNSINGTVIVRSNTPTVIPGATKTLLYLYKDNDETGLYKYIVSSQKYNYFARPAADVLGQENEYSQYDAIIISEDVDATNAEALAIIKTLRKPVLNMKIFTYSGNRLGWGDPNNGSISNTKMTILQSNHAIFSGLSSNSQVDIISEVVDRKGLMPAEVNYSGTICLATTLKRGDNYDDDGAPQTFIHEVPASVRGAKYLSFPVGNMSAEKLTADGKKLFDNMIAYLTTSTSSPVTAPAIQITDFSINGVAGVINQQALTIDVTMPKGTNLKALAPQVTLADSKLTFVTPNSGETVDFSDTHYGVVYTVSDYITKVKYTVRVLIPSDLDGIEADGLWMGGDVLHNTQGAWVNIFSVSGQLITTTNSDFSFESLPRGIYVVRSQNGMLKVMH